MLVAPTNLNQCSGCQLMQYDQQVSTVSTESMCVYMQYEDETLQAIALSVIPEERLREQARTALAGERAAQQENSGSAGSAPAGKPTALSEQDAFVRQLPNLPKVCHKCSLCCQ